MRLAVCALSAVLLSGCSWLGGMGNLVGGHGGTNYGKTSHYGGQYAPRHGGIAAGQHNPCVVYSPRAPIPRGCDPASVTIGSASGGFPQQPNFGGGNYASGGYGSHADVAGQQAAHYQPRKRLRKPKLRGSLSLGLEKSFSGELLDYDSVPGLDPALNYNPADFNEGSVEGSPAQGAVVDTTYTALIEDISRPNISFDDVHSTPLSLKGGLEYILTPKTTVFANAGYTYSEGENGNAVGVQGRLRRIVTTDNYTTIPAVAAVPEIPAIPSIPALPGTPEIPAIPGVSPGFPAIPGTPGVPGTPGQPAIPGSPEMFILDNTTVNVGFVPNENIANFAYDFSDQRRVDLEVGGRHYFNPIIKDQGYKTLTPFVGASIGATYHNAVSLTVSQNQRFYERAFESGGDVEDYYQVSRPTTEQVPLYDSQWVPSGQLNAGVEWQVTPKTALAFESGLRIEGAREYSNGAKGDNNIAIPFTVRGSYNF